MSCSKEQIKEWDEIETENTKQCSMCKEVKPLFEFTIHPTGRKNSQSYCIACGKEKSKKSSRGNHLRRKYGISLADYDKMFKAQNGKCKICGSERINCKGHGRFHVDHDHVTGKVRGLLCHKCNMMLGTVKDDIKILAQAIQYLSESK